MSYLFPSTTITFDAALRDIAQGSPKARALAAHALGDATDPTEQRRAADALLLALGDDHPQVRVEAAGSLGTLGGPDGAPALAASFVAPLAKRLGDGDPVVRQSAAIALGTLGHEDAFAPLVDALAGGPPDLRFQAASSLVEIDPARAYEPIARALDDADAQVVAAAALSLGAIGDVRAIPLLRARLEHPTAATRFDVAYALSQLGDATGRGVLANGLTDAERAWDAAGALAQLDDAAALGDALVDKRVPPEATARAAGLYLKLAPAGTHADAAKRVLVAALTARKVHVRGIAVEQLAEVGGPWAVAPLERAAKKNGDLLEAISAALQAIGARA